MPVALLTSPSCLPLTLVESGSHFCEHQLRTGCRKSGLRTRRRVVVCAVDAGNGESGRSGRGSAEGEQTAQVSGDASVGRLFGEDSPFLDGPLETIRPKFSREIPDSVPLNQPTVSSGEQRKRRGRRRGPFKKPEPPQAAAGAAIAGICTWLVYEGASRVYAYVSANPPASPDLPLGLTEEVNSLALSLVVFLGGISVALFGSAAVGLLLLAGSMLVKDPPPPKT